MGNGGHGDRFSHGRLSGSPYSGCLPAGEELSLLKAIFGQNSKSLEDVEDLLAGLSDREPSQAVCQLLPLLASQRGRQGAEDAMSKRLKGIQRMTWYQNQMVVRSHSHLEAAFHNDGIGTMILGDIASAWSLYEERFARPVRELTLLVRSQRSSDAATLLRKNGWKPKTGLPNVDPEFLPGQSFVSDTEDFQVELRWHVLSSCCYPGADDAFWRRARPLALKGCRTLVLDPADLLLYLSIVLPDSDRSRSGLWIADALKLVQSQQTKIDWRQLLAEAQNRDLLLPVKTLLGYLQTHFEPNVPVSTMEELDGMPVAMLERLSARYQRRPPDQRLLGNLPVLYFDYRRYGKHRRIDDGLLGFGRHLTRYWQTGSRWALVSLMLRMSKQRLLSKLLQAGRTKSPQVVAGDL